MCKGLASQALCASVLSLLQDNTYIYHNVGIAISGGADSVALFKSCLALRDRYSWNFFAIHVEHGLRGEESMLDKNFVEALCRENNIPFYVEHLQGLANLKSNVEAEARKHRYAVFERAYEHFQLDCILLAQHQQDQTESVLMNLGRGTGLQGLRAMQKCSQHGKMRILRPFLNVSKNQILQSLAENQQTYREDASNAETQYTRNKIRLEVLPLLYQIYPAMDKSIARLSEQATWDEAHFSKLVEKILKENAFLEGLVFCIPLTVLLQLDTSILVRVLRKMYGIALSKLEGIVFSDASYGLSHENSKDLISLCKSDAIQKIELPKAIFASKSKRYLHFHYDYNKINRDLMQRLNDCNALPANEVFSGKKCFSSLRLYLKNDNFSSNGKNFQAVPEEILSHAVIRCRQKGDRIQPFGMQGTQSLKKYFISKKVEEAFRDEIPLLCIENEVLWVLGVGASERLRTNNSQVYCIENIYPWM